MTPAVKCNQALLQIKEKLQTKSVLVISVILCLISILSFSGCSQDSSNNEASTESTTSKKEKKFKGFKVPLTDPALLNDYEPWQLSYLPEEPLDNKEFWSDTRIMFVWDTDQVIDDEMIETNVILSMKLDGTDIRQVIPPKTLLGDNKAFMNHIPARSPNNRYLVASMTGPGKKDVAYKVLFDLKNNTSEIIAYGGAMPDFVWTPDSENIIFYLDDKMKNYHLPTKTLTDRPFVYSSGGKLYLRDEGKTFVAFRYNRLEYSNFEGKKLKTLPLNIKRSGGFDQLSLDGRYLFFAHQQKVIFDTQKEKIIYTYPDRHFAPYDMVFDPYTNEAIYDELSTGVVKHNFIADKKKILIPFKIGIKKATIINFPPIYNKHN